MNKAILLIGIILIFGCKSESKDSEKLLSGQDEINSKIPQVNDQFQAFLDQFPKTELPIKINGCDEKYYKAPKLDLSLSSKYSPDAKYEYVYGIIPSKGNFVSTITMGEADCLIPVLTTYKLNGEPINSKPISIGSCGPDPCFECMEFMTIKKDFRIYVADTIKTYECNENFKQILGTEKIEVIYKEGKITENGVIELTEEATKKIK